MKAINALIDKITASRIDVNELFARSAFIGALNTTDISSNTYLQLMVNAKNKTYRQWETPSDPHDGDTWYKQAPQPISEMEDYTHEQLSQYPYWAFNGYQLYRYEGITWRKVDDPAELRSTMSVLQMATDSMRLGIVEIDNELGNKYTVRSGIAIELAGIEVSGGKYVRIKTGGIFTVDSGNFGIDSDGNVTMNGRINATSGQIGGYAIGATRLSSGSGTTFVALDSGTGDYAIWAGGDGAAYAPFRLKRDGTLTVTKLEILDEAGTATEQINLRNYALWKLNYHVIKSYTTSSITLSNGTTLNFNQPTVTGVTVGSKVTGSVYNVSVALSDDRTLPSTADLYTVYGHAGSWSNGSCPVYLDNGRTITVDLPASASFTRSVYPTYEIVYCTVGGHTYSSRF